MVFTNMSAKPRDGSSRRMILGWANRARPMPSICLSPVERYPLIFLARFFRIKKYTYTIC